METNRAKFGMIWVSYLPIFTMMVAEAIIKT